MICRVGEVVRKTDAVDCRSDQHYSSLLQSQKDKHRQSMVFMSQAQSSGITCPAAMDDRCVHKLEVFV